MLVILLCVVMIVLTHCQQPSTRQHVRKTATQSSTRQCVLLRCWSIDMLMIVFDVVVPALCCYFAGCVDVLMYWRLCCRLCWCAVDCVGVLKTAACWCVSLLMGCCHTVIWVCWCVTACVGCWRVASCAGALWLDRVDVLETALTTCWNVDL